jgi:hypothetical protein
MKTMTAIRCRSESGNALIIAFVFAGVVGIILASYLGLVQSRNLVRARSFAWNSAIPVLEGGIEEAFTHLNDDAVLTANQWTSIGTNSTIVYQKTRTNSDSSYFVVTLSNAVGANVTDPVIYSQGFVPTPLGKGYISRKVQITANRPRTFSKAIAAKGTIDLSGSASIDSFDSSNPAYSTNGMYDPTKRKANGGVVTGSNVNPAVDVRTGHIYGQVDTGPLGTVSASGGSIGPFGGTGIDPSYVSHDFNFSYPNQIPPTNYTSYPNPPGSGTYPVGGTNYTYKLGGGGTSNYTYYTSAQFTLSGSQNLVVTGAVTLYVANTITFSGGSYVYITPGSTLTLWGLGNSSTISGGGVVNGTGLAANFSYIGGTNNTSLTYSGSSVFIGTVNAPQADFTMSGSAGMSGAAIVNTFNDSGGAAIHYDEGLGAKAAFTLTSYREL